MVAWDTPSRNVFTLLKKVSNTTLQKPYEYHPSIYPEHGILGPLIG